MLMIDNDLYFTHIYILPSAKNAAVCKNWYTNIISILKKKKQTFYELQIYNLIVNKYSNYPPQGYNIRRRLDFQENNNIYDDNIFNIAYDNMISNIFNYLKKDNIVFLNIKESLIVYFIKYTAIYKKYCRMEILDMTDSGYIDDNIAKEYKEILLKYYNYIIT
jgi:hypothetical protein